MTLFSYQERKYWHELRRKDQIQHRKEFWSAMSAIADVEKDHEDYAEYRVKLRMAVTSWELDLHALLESRAEKYPQIKALWEDVNLSGYAAGLSSAFEILDDDDATPSVDFFRSVGVALNNAAVLLFDLPRQPPVIEDPWDPSKPLCGFEGGEIA